MAFRAQESADSNFVYVRDHFVRRNISKCEWPKSEEALYQIVSKYGPVIGGYPIWHPFVAHGDLHRMATRPGPDLGVKGMDHTVLFSHGFLTCPYSDGEDFVRSIEALPQHHCADISVEFLDVKLWAEGATPILVRCDWHRPLTWDKFIPKSVAVPLMLERLLPLWQNIDFDLSYAETWETMRSNLLGEPHGSRSSLFVDQETGIAMKRAYLAMVNSGMFGPLRLD